MTTAIVYANDALFAVVPENMTVAVVEVAAAVAMVAVVAGVQGAAVVTVVARNTIVSAVCFADLRCDISSFRMPIPTEADD